MSCLVKKLKNEGTLTVSVSFRTCFVVAMESRRAQHLHCKLAANAHHRTIDSWTAKRCRLRDSSVRRREQGVGVLRFAQQICPSMLQLFSFCLCLLAHGQDAMVEPTIGELLLLESCGDPND